MADTQVDDIVEEEEGIGVLVVVDAGVGRTMELAVDVVGDGFVEEKVVVMVDDVVEWFSSIPGLLIGISSPRAAGTNHRSLIT